MAGRALAILAFLTILGVLLGAYLIKKAPMVQREDVEVRALVIAFGSKLQNVSVLADATIVADSMQENYGPYVSPQLLRAWQESPETAPGRTTSSLWPDRIEIESLRRSSGSYEVQGHIIEVTNEGGGIGEEPSVAARRPITLKLEDAGTGFKISSVSLGRYPGDGVWKYSEPDSAGMQFMYPESLPTTFITATDWPPRVEFVAGKYSCKEGPLSASDGPITTLKKHTIGDREYCVATHSEGAAGSMYTNYEYTTLRGEAVVRVLFTLKFPQCLNYIEPNQSACKSEQNSFDIDGLADRIFHSIKTP